MRSEASGTLLYSVQQPRKPRRLADEELFEFAVKCLGMRAFSTGDLRSKLHMRAARPGAVDAVIDRLKDIGYLDDRRFAETFAAVRLQNDGFGRQRLLTDLRARRISGNLATEAVDHALDGKSEADLIDAYIERRMSSLAAAGRIDDDRKLAAAYRRLRRAGFTSGPILAALKRVAARPESLEEPPEEEESHE
jgi:regulatory protein